MSIFFISDLHLHANAPKIATQFSRFLHSTAANAQALYILGDLFEYWAGDDEDDPFNLAIIQELTHYAQRIPTYLLHGNRDFMLGKDFATRTHISLLPDPSPLEIGTQRLLLSHGDALCTEDVGYQAFRQQSRHPIWQQQVLSQPLSVRRALSAQIRQQSEAAKQDKAAYIMDVHPNAVAQLLREHDYPTLIHGHTHRSAEHHLNLDAHSCIRWVLPDWNNTQWGYLECNLDTLTLHILPLA